VGERDRDDQRMTVLGAPRHPIQTSLPSWSRFVVEGGRRFVRVDARSQLGCVTHSELFLHGATQSIMCSADVRSTMLFGNTAYEGIGVAVQAYVRDASRLEGIRLVWQRRPDLQGIPGLWVHEQYADFTPVDFEVQIPDDVSPDYIRVTWVTNGYFGRTDITNFAVRDFYARTYPLTVPGTVSPDSYVFTQQTASNLLSSGSAVIWAHYLDTWNIPIKKGQPLDLFVSGEVVRGTMVNSDVARVPVIGYIGLKLLRRKDGGSDWLYSRIAASEDPTVLDGIDSFSIRRPAKNAYTQVEPLIFMIPNAVNNNIIQTRFNHNGFDLKLTVDDSVESGTG